MESTEMSNQDSDRDSSPELDLSSERCLTPVPQDEDIFEDLMTFQDGFAADRDESSKMNGRTPMEESGKDDDEPIVPRLCGMAIDVLRTYYEEGPEACRKKPQFGQFYNLVDSLLDDEGQSLEYVSLSNDDGLSMFVHPEAEVPKPPHHNGYRRVLDESIWQTVDSKVPVGEAQETENQSEQESIGEWPGQQIDVKCLSVESKKAGGSLLSFLSKADGRRQKSVAESIRLRDEAKPNSSGIQINLSESKESVPHSLEPEENNLNPSNGLHASHDVNVGTPDINPGLPNHPPKTLGFCPVLSEIETSRTERNPTELDEKCLTSEAPKEPEINEWDEELDYEL